MGVLDLVFGKRMRPQRADLRQNGACTQVGARFRNHMGAASPSVFDPFGSGSNRVQRRARESWRPPFRLFGDPLRIWTMTSTHRDELAVDPYFDCAFPYVAKANHCMHLLRGGARQNPLFVRALHEEVCYLNFERLRFGKGLSDAFHAVRHAGRIASENVARLAVARKRIANLFQDVTGYLRGLFQRRFWRSTSRMFPSLPPLRHETTVSSAPPLRLQLCG